MIEDPPEYEEQAGDDSAPVVAFPDPDLDECPVVPLGFLGGQVVFGMPAGDIRQEPASRIAGMLKTDVFVCREGQKFLTHWRDEEGKFQRDLAAVWFNRACRDAGLWDDARPKRSIGVWPTDRDDQVVVHVGDAICETGGFGEDDWTPIAKTLRRRKGPIYLRAPAHPRPYDPLTAAEASIFPGLFARWNFEPIGEDGLTGADVLLGWIGAAMLGAVAPFRGHLLLYGLLGCGKTSLVRLVHAIMSSIAGDVLNDFTEAGFRNALAFEARPVLLDEAEASASGDGPVEKALDLLRRMATGDGGRRRMGSIGGGSSAASIVGAALLGAITPPKLSAADASRFVEVRLKPLGEAKAGADEALAADRARAEALSPRLLARLCRDAGRYRADVRAMKAALGEAGLEPRAADLLSMLAAGRRLILNEDPLTPDAAGDEVRFWAGLVERRKTDDSAPNEGASCLAHLLAHETGLQREGRRLSVGELVEADVRQLVAGQASAHDEPLRQLGLQVWFGSEGDDPRAPWLLVANNHPALARVFGGTRWADWKRSLELLDALGPDWSPRPTKGAKRFGLGVVSRALCVPLAPWTAQGVTTRYGGVTPSVTGQVAENTEETPGA